MIDDDEIVKAHRQGYKEGGDAGEILRGAMADKIKAMTKENDELKAKLAKAVEALVSLVKQASTTSSRGAVTGPHWTHLTLAILKARTTLAEIEGKKTW
jgi:hypothetical protein